MKPSGYRTRLPTRSLHSVLSSDVLVFDEASTPAAVVVVWLQQDCAAFVVVAAFFRVVTVADVAVRC